jgi:hypothetical protein
MASSYNNLGIELQATGENAGTWGTKTNTNLDLIAETWGYISIDVAGADVTLAMTSGSSSNGRNYILEFTGTLAGNRVVDIPAQAGSPAANIEKGFIVVDKTNRSGSAYSLTFKVTGATGVTLRALPADKSSAPVTTFVYDNGTDIIDASKDVALSFTDAQYIADNSGNELLTFGVTGSAVNEFTLANAATGNGPILSSTGETNVDININPKGSGTLKSGSAAVKIAGTETIWVPALAMFGTTTNGADAQAVETTALRPELKVLDFDASTRENAQFAIAMPKSWNLGTVTYQVFWSPSNTNTDNCIFGLEGVSCTEGDTADVAFGTAVEVTDAGIGTVEDVQMSPVSGAVTIGGSPADNDQTFFQLYRDAADGSDDFTGDARVLGIKLFYTTDAANDA